MIVLDWNEREHINDAQLGKPNIKSVCSVVGIVVLLYHPYSIFHVCFPSRATYFCPLNTLFTVFREVSTCLCFVGLKHYRLYIHVDMLACCCCAACCGYYHLTWMFFPLLLFVYYFVWRCFFSIPFPEFQCAIQIYCKTFSHLCVYAQSVIVVFQSSLYFILQFLFNCIG